jgi:hypothetical protein
LRAAARLAALFRHAGQRSDEEAVLRDIVQRSTDPDELEAVGQRLLTVALGNGRSAELVRWIDAVLPQHPRRDALGRLRSAAYDAWLRAVPLDEALGLAGPPPTGGALGEALGSGDLALQARALRQMARSRRALPPAVARQLLGSPNAALRRDTALALGASASEEAAAILRDALSEGLDPDEDVLTAEVAALLNLPAVPGLDPPLLSLAARNDWHLAVLALGRAGGGDAVHELVRRVQSPRNGGGPTEWVPAVGKGVAADWLALAATVARMPQDPRMALARQAILEAAQRIGPQSLDVARQVATLWALRVIAHPQSAAELARVAVTADQVAVRRVAVLLLATAEAPRIEVPLPAVGQGDTVRGLRGRAARDLLAPWLGADTAQIATALAQTAADLAVAVAHHRQAIAASQGPAAGAAWQLQWCAQWGAARPVDAPAWQALCPPPSPLPVAVP